MLVRRQIAALKAFAELLGRGDPLEVARLITDDFEYIDARGEHISGKSAAIAGLGVFRRLQPDFRIEIETITTARGEFLLRGHCRSSDPRFSAPTLWRARMRGERLSAWQSYRRDAPSIVRVLESATLAGAQPASLAA